jgi:hypothetical protein
MVELNEGKEYFNLDEILASHMPHKFNCHMGEVP